MIVGAGTIGLLLLQVVGRMNPARIIISDISDYRLGLAKELGADCVINPRDTDLRKAIDAQTESEGVDIAFEAVGISQTVQQAISALKMKGTCIWIGNSAKMIDVNMQEVVIRELTIIGTYAYTHKDFGYAIDLLVEKKFNLDSIISSVVPLEDGPEMFHKLAKDLGQLIKVILTL